MIRVMVFGTFDGLHAGHLSYFQQAKKYGDHLTAVVALDENVAKFKGRQPKFSQTERLEAVKACGLVDEAILGGKKIFDILDKRKPDVACLGYDQQTSVNELQQLFPNIKIVRLKPYRPKKYKSSLLNQ